MALPNYIGDWTIENKKLIWPDSRCKCVFRGPSGLPTSTNLDKSHGFSSTFVLAVTARKRLWVLRAEDPVSIQTQRVTGIGTQLPPNVTYPLG